MSKFNSFLASSGCKFISIERPHFFANNCLYVLVAQNSMGNNNNRAEIIRDVPPHRNKAILFVCK
jgi:hypothetical protein